MIGGRTSGAPECGVSGGEFEGSPLRGCETEGGVTGALAPAALDELCSRGGQKSETQPHSKGVARRHEYIVRLPLYGVAA